MRINHASTAEARAHCLLLGFQETETVPGIDYTLVREDGSRALITKWGFLDVELLISGPAELEFYEVAEARGGCQVEALL